MAEQLTRQSEPPVRFTVLSPTKTRGSVVFELVPRSGPSAPLEAPSLPNPFLCELTGSRRSIDQANFIREQAWTEVVRELARHQALGMSATELAELKLSYLQSFNRHHKALWWLKEYPKFEEK
jgi:hypothetical protein